MKSVPVPTVPDVIWYSSSVILFVEASYVPLAAETGSQIRDDRVAGGISRGSFP